MRRRQPYGFNTDDLQTRISIGEVAASIILAAVIDRPDPAVEARRLCYVLESALLNRGAGEATAQAVADNVDRVVQMAIDEAKAERGG